jgi:hypothetical protein
LTPRRAELTKKIGQCGSMSFFHALL